MTTDLKKLITLLYGIFAVSAAIQFTLVTVVLGCIALIAAVVILYKKRPQAAGTVYESHVAWLLRTFWIGGGVYLPALTLIELAVLYVKVDFSSLMDRMASGEITDPMQVESILMTEYGPLLKFLTIACTLPFLAWWLWRCWRGYDALKADKPVGDPMRWL